MIRDPLVEEFRNTNGKGRSWELRDILGHVTSFCQDQHGSRFIQQRLEECTDVDKQLVFDEIVPSATSLMTDVFGNYVLQKLFEFGTAEQCEALAVLLQGQAVNLSMHMYGCRVMQRALEYVGTSKLLELVGEFENPQVSYSGVFIFVFLFVSIFLMYFLINFFLSIVLMLTLLDVVAYALCLRLKRQPRDPKVH